VDASSSRFDMVGGGVMVRVGRGLKSEKKEMKKKKKKTVTRVRRNLRSRPYPPTVHTYIYIIAFDRRFFPNGRLLETHCCVYTYLRIYIIYLYTTTISATMYILYIYSRSRITVLISFSVSLALYNRHARREECTSYTCIYIYIFSRNYSIRFFFFILLPTTLLPPSSTHRHRHSVSYIEIPRHISSPLSTSARQVYKHTHTRASSLSIATRPPLVKALSSETWRIVLPKQPAPKSAY
jgi:hypothetical protein